MDQNAIFAPFLALMLLTLLVWVYMYARRLPFIQRSGLRPQQFTSAELARLSPPAVSNPSDNLKNLFEVPTLFYPLALYLYATGRVDATYVAAAWVFVCFRAAHSAVHCTINIVLLRFCLYACSTLALAFMIARAAYAAFI